MLMAWRAHLRARVEGKNSRRGWWACQLFLQRQVTSSPLRQMDPAASSPDNSRGKSSPGSGYLSAQRVSKRNLSEVGTRTCKVTGKGAGRHRMGAGGTQSRRAGEGYRMEVLGRHREVQRPEERARLSWRRLSELREHTGKPFQTGAGGGGRERGPGTPTPGC